MKKNKNVMNVGICVISKNEERFLDEWIVYHKNIGIDKIYFYDNNDGKSNEEQKKIVCKYDFITYIDFRNKKNNQKFYAYKHFYKVFSHECDFIFFIDVDEFITPNKSLLKDIIAQYNEKNILELIRVNYGDNDVFHNKYESVIDTFSNNKYVVNDYNKKCAINCKTIGFKFISKYGKAVENSQYIPYSNSTIEKEAISMEHIYIRHFETRSFTDFLKKLKMGRSDTNIYSKPLLNDIERKLISYFKIHPITEKKIRLIAKTFENFEINEDIIKNVDYFINKTKIDYVFPFVDCGDEEWQNEFKKYYYGSSFKNDNGNGEVRYDSYGFLKYKFRTIEENMPWINNIYMIVSSKKQIPDWLNTDKVKIVLHEEFIPKEFLPTFNSNTIDMFIHKIKGLSECFIYSNDDCYITYKTTPRMFFIKNKPLLYINNRNIGNTKTESSKLSENFCINCIELAQKDLNKKINLEKTCYNPQHHDKPMLKSINEYIYEKYKNEIHSSITKFRDIKNLSQRLYHFYNVFHKNYIPYKLNTTFILFKENNFEKEYEKINDKVKNNSSLISIDFDVSLPNEKIELIKNIFEKKYPNKSIYEKNV